MTNLFNKDLAQKRRHKLLYNITISPFYALLNTVGVVRTDTFAKRQRLKLTLIKLDQDEMNQSGIMFVVHIGGPFRKTIQSKLQFQYCFLKMFYTALYLSINS